MKRLFVRLTMILAAFGLAFFLWLLFVVDQFGYADRAQPADAIVVLGSMVFPGGRAGPSLERRTQQAAILYRRGLAPMIICSGGTGTNPPAEAVVACGRLAALGVPETALLREDQSHSTEQNAAYTAVLMRARGWQSVIVVSDGYHLYRAAQMFERTGLTVYSSPATGAATLNPPERVLREMRETIAVIWFWLRVGLGADPTRATPPAASALAHLFAQRLDSLYNKAWKPRN